MPDEVQRSRAQVWFESLRDRICAAFEALEEAHAGAATTPAGRFERQPWDRPGGGGGVMATMRGRAIAPPSPRPRRWRSCGPAFRICPIPPNSR